MRTYSYERAEHQMRGTGSQGVAVMDLRQSYVPSLSVDGFNTWTDSYLGVKELSPMTPPVWSGV